MPLCKYRCFKCYGLFTTERAGMVTCFCGYEYVQWLNFQEIVDWLMENDADYRISYSPKK